MDITLRQLKRFNQRSKVHIFLRRLKNITKLQITHAAFSPSVEHARHGSMALHVAAACWMVMGQWLQSQWIHARPSTCWHFGNKLPVFEAPTLTAQTLSHWRKWKGSACKCPEEWIAEMVWLCLMLVPVIKRKIEYGAYVMCTGLYDIRVWSWDWESIQDHVLIKHGIQRTHQCSAPVVGHEGIQLMTVEQRPRYSSLQLPGDSVACGSGNGLSLQAPSHYFSQCWPKYIDIWLH